MLWWERTAWLTMLCTETRKSKSVCHHDYVIKWEHFPRLNKRLCKQSWDWWFETLSRSFWRHCNDIDFLHAKPWIPVWRSQTSPVLRLPPEPLRMRTVKDIKVNVFVFVYRSHTYHPRLRWEHLSVHRTLFGFILWNENISNASSLITRVRSD